MAGDVERLGSVDDKETQEGIYDHKYCSLPCMFTYMYSDTVVVLHMPPG